MKGRKIDQILRWKGSPRKTFIAAKRWENFTLRDVRQKDHRNNL